MRVLAVGAAATLAACVRLVTPAGGEQVDDRYSVSGGSFNSGGTIIVMLRAFERGGETVVCGARTNTRMALPSPTFEYFVLGAGVVQLAGTNLLQGIQRFPVHPLERDLTGAPSDCFDTGRPWRPEFDGARPVASFARMQFQESEDGVEDIFRESSVPDVIARP